MHVYDLLTSDRVVVANEIEGTVRSKTEVLHRLATLLAKANPTPTESEIENSLIEREALQSTGIGGGVAIPHASVENIESQVGAVLLSPVPVDFDAIDGAPVSIFFALIGPRNATGEHLKTLARISRLLRDESFRSRLRAAESGVLAYSLLSSEERNSLP